MPKCSWQCAISLEYLYKIFPFVQESYLKVDTQAQGGVLATAEKFQGLDKEFLKPAEKCQWM